MVELNGPVGMLVRREATEGHVEQVIARSPRMQRMAQHGWMRLGRIDPDTGAISLRSTAGWTPWRAQLPEAMAYAQSPTPPCFDLAHDRLLEASA